MSRIKTYGNRFKFKNPFNKKSGWIILNMARSFKKEIMKLEGY